MTNLMTCYFWALVLGSVLGIIKGAITVYLKEHPQAKARISNLFGSWAKVAKERAAFFKDIQR